MKKKIVISIVCILLVTCAVTVILLLQKHNKSDETNNPDTVKYSLSDWLDVSTAAQLENMAENTGKKYSKEAEDIYIYDLQFGEETGTYGYHIDANGNITELNIGIPIVSSKKSGEEYIMNSISNRDFRVKVEKMLTWIEEVLTVRIGSNYYIYTNNNEILTSDDDASFEQILDGNATLELRILDTDDSVWIFEVGKVQGYNIVSATLSHYNAESEYAQAPCYVLIEQ